MSRQPFSLDAKVQRYLEKQGIAGVSVEDSVVWAGSYTERLTGAVTFSKLDALAERIKAATGGGAG